MFVSNATGKNDGSVKGVRYFKCRARHGLFVRHDKLIMDKRRKSSGGVTPKSGSRTSNVRRSTGNLAVTSPQGQERSTSPRNVGGGDNVPSYMRPTFSSRK